MNGASRTWLTSGKRRRVVRFSLGRLCAIVVLGGGGAVFGFAPQAYAAVDMEPPNPAKTEAVPRFGWGLQLNGGLGAAALAYADNGALVGRVGLDAEYWLSKNVGIGGQVAFESAKTIDVGGAYNTGSTSRASLAPAIAIRGNSPTSFPILTVALGYALGSSTEYHSCDLNTCPATYWTVSGSGPYASLMGHGCSTPGMCTRKALRSHWGRWCGSIGLRSVTARARLSVGLVRRSATSSSAGVSRPGSR